MNVVLTLELTPECILKSEISQIAMERGLQIGKVAKATGLTADTIRYYEKQRLLRSAGRSEGGFRLFTEHDVEDLKFITRAQDLGFSLNEIRELLLLRSDVQACSHVRDLVGEKVESVQAKIAQLRTLEVELTKCLQRCDRAMKAGGPHSVPCPVLNGLAVPKGRRKATRHEG